MSSSWARLLRCCAVLGHQYHRTTVLSNGFSWQGMRPTREGLPLLQLGQACKGSTQVRCEGWGVAGPVPPSGDAERLNGQVPWSGGEVLVFVG